MTETQTAPPAKLPTPNLNKALSLLQGKLPKITKGKHVKVDGKEGKRGFEYDYAELADVAAAVYPLLAEFGLAFHCAVTRDPDDRRLMILEWFLLHESGEERSGEWPLGPANQSSQSLGSAITYGRRYILGTATGAVTEDDDDGERAQQAHSGRQSAGDAWATSTPARPVNLGPRQEAISGNGQQHGQAQDRPGQPQRPEIPPQEPLAPEDTWAQLIGDMKKLEDCQEAETALKEAYGRQEISGERTTQVLYWIRQKAAQIRQQDDTGTEAAPAGDDPASAWISAFRAEVAEAGEDQLGPMRGRIGRAVQDRTITPEQGSALNQEINQRRRALQQDQAEAA